MSGSGSRLPDARVLPEEEDPIGARAGPGFPGAVRPFHDESLELRSCAEPDMDPRVAPRQVAPVGPRASPDHAAVAAQQAHAGAGTAAGNRPPTSFADVRAWWTLKD